MGAGRVVFRDAKGKKDTLHHALPSGDMQRLTLPGIVGQLALNMPFILRAVVVAVDNAHGVVELHTEFESQAAARKALQNPAFLHTGADSRGQMDLLPRRRPRP